MKVYLAARYSSKLDIAKKADELRLKGIDVTAVWMDEPHPPDGSMDQVATENLIVYAHQDIWDIDRSNILVFFSVDPTIPTVRGGRHVEFGYALGRKIPILVVGPRENIFHHLPEINQVDTWEEAKAWLMRQ